ncbi:MAG TPA: FtsX-like permease family protein [Thermoplasmata archaeon]|nr:FtsX-like permease family protein [Thermoplasmata archaeon]
MAAPLVVLLIAIVVVILGISAILAVRHRITWRIAVRNFRRGRWRTVLIVLGLLVATTIVSGSLVIGDTVNAVSVHFTYQALGHTDEGVYNESPAATYTVFPASYASGMITRLAGDPDIAGIIPEVGASVTIFDRTSGVPQTQISLLGADPNTTGALGTFTSDSGAALVGPSPGHVFLDDLAASDLNASVGDTVVVYGVATMPAIVQAIVHDDDRGGFLGGPNVFTNLATAQALENYSTDSINLIAVANAGTVQSAVALSDTVSAKLNATLAALGAPVGLKVHELLKDSLAQAETAGNGLTTLFLALGLFSIVAGAMLIVGIFVMIAEERKGEMGMLRAIGLTRYQLVLVYYFEGLLYSVGSALAGTLLGVGVGFGLTYAFSVLFSGGGVTAAAILDSFTVTPQSLVIAYVVGFVLTVLTVLGTSFRVSRLNIVSAIRSVPEPPPTLRTYSQLAYIGVGMAALGALILDRTYAGTTDISEPLIGGALLILGVAFVASRFVRNRPVFTAAGIALLLWGGVSQLRHLLLGTAHTGTIFVIFAEGILLVLGALLVYGFNSDLLVRAVVALTQRRPKTVPIVRVGLSYPGRRPFRTAVNLAIFSLVIFTVVAVASFGASVSNGLSAEIQSQSGGYTYYAYAQNPIPDLPGQIAANHTLAPLFSEVVPLITGPVAVNATGFGTAYADAVHAAPTNASPSSDFYSTNQYNFSSTLDGRSAASIFQLLATNDSVAVVDSGYAAGGVSFSFGPAHPSVSVGQTITLTSGRNADVEHLEVVGLLSESFVSGVFVNPHVAARLNYTGTNTFLIKTAPGVGESRAADLLKAAFFPYGLITFDFAQILQSSIQTTQAIIGLLEIFVALGLAVGIAGMGIVALRAVVERRTEIGMLRAEGQTQVGVLTTFLLEYSYIALLGIGIGTSLGIVLDYQSSGAGVGDFQFTVPWANIALVILVAYGLTIAAIIGPSIKAARLPPAEAVRYSE